MNTEYSKYFVTGVCGTVGSAILESLVEKLGPDALVVGVDNSESGIFHLINKYKSDKRFQFYVSDVRDGSDLELRMRGAEVVLHLAALKHVILSEASPSQAIATNITGVENVIDAALKCKVSKVIFTSSDKAVNPTNVMGTSKLMGERLITAAHINNLGGGTVFASTRFGNVLGSNGSVVPIFKQQIQNELPVTVTDAQMSRFIMSIRESADLVLRTVQLAEGGEVYVTKMPAVNIVDIAKVMINKLSKRSGPDEIDFIGSKPGEKLYEELMSDEETGRAFELDDYFVILPTFNSDQSLFKYNVVTKENKKASSAYNSSIEKKLTRDELDTLLESYGIF